MKVKFKFKPDIREVESLIERYFDGRTTNEEERRLYHLLSHPSFKKEYEAEKAMLSYFKEEKPTLQLLPVLRNVAVVALILFSGTLAIQLLTTEAYASYAYVNGKKVTNISTIRKHAWDTLATLPSSDKVVENSLKEVSSEQLIENQLSVFAEIK